MIINLSLGILKCIFNVIIVVKDACVSAFFYKRFYNIYGEILVGTVNFYVISKKIYFDCLLSFISF